MLRKIALLLLIIVAGSATGLSWMAQQIEKYVSTPVVLESPELVTVPEGAHFRSMLNVLQTKGLVAPSDWSRWAPKVYPELASFRAGTYLVKPDMTLRDVFDLFRVGKEHQFSITFVEGSRFSEWREQLAKTGYLTHDSAALSEAQIAEKIGVKKSKLEGLLLPETYHYVAGQSELSILKRAADEMNKALEKAWSERNTSVPLKTSYELLTLASIVEKETAVDGERPKVASVFANRLNKRMRLQTDPTVIYGMGDKFQGNITKKDLREKTPYNTYVINGLPPTPIAMPGAAAIMAAANPEKTPYFYFVANGTGGHTFSKTLSEHNRAVKKLIQIQRRK
ncbi:ABC transporter substrate-binding protein [Veronia nyctiphanis]|uniref:Endolytic murein transglycosylase n=1 Tax=Veronia nyctiphanis TaxID=1278244 RepID=A0A4Q0YVS0_9GAMM|nr:endolytic transglycosylase MltG [Veronia nyctiphanis]RXJ74905.1 ABC transporter substrate-binding protein [Veronia nyctiphanis]